MSEGVATAGRFAAGSSLGGLTVVRLLGAGRVGEVYLVRHDDTDRLDALRVVADETDPALTRRLLVTLGLAAGLQHPHLVAVRQVGAAGTPLAPGGPPMPQPWALMQYVDGSTLTQLAATEALTPSRILDLLTQIADGLDAAHRIGLLHRDVRPDAVLLHREALGQEHAYVSGLGIAEALDAATRLTGLQGTVDTARYVSPERWSGASLVDARTDVYSLACVASELLGGPVPGDRSADPTAPASSSSPMGREVDEVLRKGLADDPRDRYGTCPNLVAALRGALASSGSVGSAAVRPQARLAEADAVPPDPLPRRPAGRPAPVAVPAAQPAGASVGKRPGRALLAAVGVAAVVVLTVALLNGPGQDSQSGGTAAAGGPPAADPSPDSPVPRDTARPAVVVPPPPLQWISGRAASPSERAVLDVVRTSFADTGRCGDAGGPDPRDVVPGGATNIVCSYPGGRTVVFSRFPTDALLTDFFEERIGGRGLRDGQGAIGPRPPWQVDLPGKPGRGYGNLNRNRPIDPVRTEIGWILDGTRTYAYAYRPGSDFPAFYRWWSGVFRAG